MKTALALVLFAAWSTPCLAGSKYTVVHVDDPQRLELFLQDESGTPFHRFEKLSSWLQARKKQLRFAMNAGMFEPDYSPVGLFIARTQELAPLNLRAGHGNFYMKPNGVFLITSDGPRIVDAAKYSEKPSDALYFDGTVSALYSSELGRNDSTADLGPIIGLVE